MKNKKRIRIWRILAIFSFILGITLLLKSIPNNKISTNLQINNTNSIINIENIDDIVVSQNVPIPVEIKEKMQKEEEERKIAEQKLIEQKQKEEEEKQKIALEKKKQVTSRGNSVSRENDGEWVAFNASAYCPCVKCCGKTNGITASGTKATAGRTVAMPKGYSFGTRIEIKGMGTYIVEDRGGAIKGNKIDIFFNTHQEALNFGRKTVYLRVVK